MSTFAILGATGQTGQQLTKLILLNPSNKLNLYVRSESKLLALFPDLKSNKNVTIFSGSLSDVNLIKECTSNTKAVFSVLASNENLPGMTIARDAAACILAALRKMKEEDKNVKLPRVVVLSSASLNPLLYNNGPWFVHVVIYNAFWHIYQDLEKAVKLYEAAQQDGLDVDVKYIQPGALVEGDGCGSVKLTKEEYSPVVAYGELALAMLMAAEDEGLNWRDVGVLITGEESQLPKGLPLVVMGGLGWSFMPWVMRALRGLGVV